MSREQLLDALLVERHTPIPARRVLSAALPPDVTGGPDTPEAQQARRDLLLAATEPDRGPWRAEDAAERAEATS